MSASHSRDTRWRLQAFVDQEDARAGRSPSAPSISTAPTAWIGMVRAARAILLSVKARVDPHQRRILNLGSGKTYDPTAINVDITADTEPDIVHDLDVTPWPFADSSFSHVRAIDVLEHLKDPLTAMNEIHRVASDKALVEIALPHFSSANAYSDLTHRGLFGYLSFDPITGDSPHDYYSRRRFRMLNREIIFYHRPVNRVVRHLANRHPLRYEQRWAWIFPAWFLSFKLQVCKEDPLVAP